MNEHLPENIREAVKNIKAAILQSQYRAAKGVNKEQLSLYFGIGRYVSEHSRKGFWGTGAIERISGQLQKELPKSAQQKRPPAEGDLKTVDYTVLLQQNRQPMAAEMLNEFLSVSFTHHIEIITKAKDVQERLFYIHQTFANSWDKYKLRDMLKADLFHHQGKLPNNFSTAIPDSRTALQAIEMFKDEYLLDFINVEELGERDKEDVDEHEVENSIIHNVKNFIMTFGHDFTFVGNQYHLEKFGHDAYPDLLFYNRELAALVAVELKRGAFKPAYLGQLSAYLRILDSEVKKPFENPSIGIILCKDADKGFVEFLIQGYENPMGVATYKTAEDVRKVLPPEEDLRKAMDVEILSAPQTISKRKKPAVKSKTKRGK